MKKAVVIVAIAVVAVFVVTTRRAEVYREVQSDDASWSVVVLRKKNRLYPVIEGVDVIVRVKDKDGKVVFDRIIDNRDLWSDVDDRYREVVCTPEVIKIGPEYWDGKAMTYFTIDRALHTNLSQ